MHNRCDTERALEVVKLVSIVLHKIITQDVSDQRIVTSSLLPAEVGVKQLCRKREAGSESPTLQGSYGCNG